MTHIHALIIDDNANNLGVLAELLAIEGATITKIQDPRKLEAMLESLAKVDVVFLDLEMPGLNGYEVLARLKSDARFGNVPVVAYTVHVSEIGVTRTKGFDSFLGKPLDAERFPTQLQKILRGEKVWAISSNLG
jgi:two-component system, cell cycle response regulator DivK